MGFKAKELVCLYPPFQKKLIELERKCEKQGLKIKFSCGYRSSEEQNHLYEQGRSRPGNIVTNARGGYSQHNFGIAADFYRNEPGKGAFDESGEFFEKVGAIAVSLGLGWGGNWKSFKDKPHVYWPEWGSTTTMLRQQYGNFDNFLRTWEYWEYSVKVESVPQECERYTKRDFIKDVQNVIGVEVDGIAGPKTLDATPTISESKNRNHAVVKVVQHWLNMNGHLCGIEDGIFGKNTKAGVMHYQKYIGFQNPDGVMDSGQRTWKAILC